MIRLRVTEGLNAPDQMASCAFPSFLVEVQANADYMRRMRNNNLAAVVQIVDSAILWINLYPVDNAILFSKLLIHRINHYPAFEQPGPGD